MTTQQYKSVLATAREARKRSDQAMIDQKRRDIVMSGTRKQIARMPMWLSGKRTVRVEAKLIDGTMTGQKAGGSVLMTYEEARKNGVYMKCRTTWSANGNVKLYDYNPVVGDEIVEE